MSEEVIKIKDVLRRLQGDTELLVELVKIFLKDAPLQLKKIKRFMSQSDFMDLAHIAHSLKGAALNIGAEKISKSFYKMEKAANQADLTKTKKAFQQVSKDCLELKKYFPSLKKQFVC